MSWAVELELVVVGNITSAVLVVKEDTILEGDDESTLTRAAVRALTLAEVTLGWSVLGFVDGDLEVTVYGTSAAGWSSSSWGDLFSDTLGS